MDSSFTRSICPDLQREDRTFRHEIYLASQRLAVLRGPDCCDGLGFDMLFHRAQSQGVGFGGRHAGLPVADPQDQGHSTRQGFFWMEATITCMVRSVICSS